jgi:hypothetical protein
LAPRADHNHRRLRQFLQVSAHVRAVAAVDAADAAGGKDLDAETLCDPHGGGYGGGAIPALRHDDGQGRGG